MKNQPWKKKERKTRTRIDEDGKRKKKKSLLLRLRFCSESTKFSENGIQLGSKENKIRAKGQTILSKAMHIWPLSEWILAQISSETPLKSNNVNRHV